MTVSSYPRRCHGLMLKGLQPYNLVFYIEFSDFIIYCVKKGRWNGINKNQIDGFIFFNSISKNNIALLKRQNGVFNFQNVVFKIRYTIFFIRNFIFKTESSISSHRNQDLDRWACIFIYRITVLKTKNSLLRNFGEIFRN